MLAANQNMDANPDILLVKSFVPDCLFWKWKLWVTRALKLWHLLVPGAQFGASTKWRMWSESQVTQVTQVTDSYGICTAYVRHMPLGIPWVLDSSRTGPMAVSSGRRLGSKNSRVTLARFICYHVLSCPLRRHIVIHCISSCMLLWHGMHFYETCASKSIARESFAPETSMWLVLSWRAWTWGCEELLENCWRTVGLLDPDPQREVIDPILHPISRF